MGDSSIYYPPSNVFGMKFGQPDINLMLKMLCHLKQIDINLMLKMLCHLKQIYSRQKYVKKEKK